MIEILRLDGHSIRIELLEVAPGRFRWTSQINGQRPLKGPCTLPSRAMARSEALLYAQLAVGRLTHGGATIF